MIEKFNKYIFIDTLSKEVESEIKNGSLETLNAVERYISEWISNACIYSGDCFEICQELNATHFDEFEAECKTIYDLAFWALTDFVNGKVDYSEIQDLINAQEQEAE